MKVSIGTRIAIAAMALALLAASTAYAECGPGPIITSNSKGTVTQTLGVSTNTILFPTHTLGITFGTSGCSNSGIIKAEYEQRLFVQSNYDALQGDMAQGQGESLTALASLMGCPGSSVQAVGDWTREHYEELAPAIATAPSILLATLKRGLTADPLLSRNCTNLG